MTDDDIKAVEEAKHQDAINTAEKEIIHLYKVGYAIPTEMVDAVSGARERLVASTKKWLALVQK